MRAEELALVRGMADTKAALRRWQRVPFAAVGPWAGYSLLTAIGLLSATWLVATLSTPDATPLHLVGIDHPAEFRDYGFVLFRNSLVLALHALACVAGFIAGSSLPHTAAQLKDGLWRRIHDRAGPLAIGFVVCATTFSLVTQAFVLGGGTASLAATVVTVLLAVPVLVAAAFVEVYVSPGVLRSLGHG